MAIKEIDDGFWDEVILVNESDFEETKHVVSTIDLFRYKQLRWLTLKMMVIWFSIVMTYYGISLNVGSLAGSIFVDNALQGTVEIGSIIFCYFTIDYFGRRNIMELLMLISMLGLIGATITDQYSDDNKTLEDISLAFALFAKFGVAGAFSVIYIYTCELYPTVIRSNGIGISSTVSRIGSIIAPYLLGLQNQVEWLPDAVFATFALFPLLAVYTLPETSGKMLCKTIEEGEEFLSTRRVLFSCCKRSASENKQYGEEDS